jgi:hypothetical protein
VESDRPWGRADSDESAVAFIGGGEAEPGPIEAGTGPIEAGTGPIEAETGPIEAETTDLEVAVLDAIEKELADVERALERLGDGSYGRCESCGQVLSDEELESAPVGRFCPAHLALDQS